MLVKKIKVKAWKKDWEETTAKDGKEIKKAIGQDATVSLFDEFDKKLYTYGDNWGRGGYLTPSIWFKNATRTTKVNCKSRLG